MGDLIDMGEYSYRIKLLKMYKDPVYFAEQMFPETKFDLVQKAYLSKFLGINVEEKSE